MLIVTGDEYAQYYAALERKKYIRKQERGKKISYEKALEDGLPIDLLSANSPITVEEEAEKNILIERMLKAVGQLDESEKTLIHLLFFNGISMRNLSKKTGVPLTTLHRNRERILKKIKKLMGFKLFGTPALFFPFSVWEKFSLP
jgi:RNA polymerase sigma factor (sigma-70 family)